MHATTLSSCRLFHDGDFDGCMYLTVPAGSQEAYRGIVVTRTMLERALAADTAPVIALTGPNGDLHDRHAVTQPTYAELAPGDWTTLTVHADRADIERFVLWHRVRQIADAADAFGAPGEGHTFAESLARLDAIVAQFKALTQPAPAQGPSGAS